MQEKRQKCTVYARVCGFITPLDNWNKGKRQEYNDREMFNVSERIKHQKTK